LDEDAAGDTAMSVLSVGCNFIALQLYSVLARCEQVEKLAMVCQDAKVKS